MNIYFRYITNLLRGIYLLQLVDTVVFALDVIRNHRANKRFLIRHPHYSTPPKYLAYDAYNHTNWDGYYEGGMSHSRLISDLVREFIPRKNIKIFEWGCGPARVIRHLNDITGYEKIELYGSDYNEKSIEWCKKTIKHVHFFNNKLTPPLPFDNAMFDCVYAISIFTHLSEKMHYAWIEELFRVLKPDGILIFTTQGNFYSEKLLPVDKALYDSGELVIKGKTKEGKKLYSAYHPPKFIENKLLNGQVVLRHIDTPSNYNLQQEVWIVRKQKEQR